MIASPLLVRRSLYLLAILACAWALIALATGGLGWMIGPLRLSSRQPLRPAIVGVVAALFYARRFSRVEQDKDGRWLLRSMQWALLLGPLLAIVLGFVVGIHYGSFAAAGSDSYGYVSQAPLWLKGNLHIRQPWVQQMSWPAREWSFAPLGYRPSSLDGTIVPTYAPGLPMLMAIFLAIFGGNGPFYVVPVLGAVALCVTYLLGVEITRSRSVAAGAVFLLLCSPVFLAHLMLPMTDVPMAAGWTMVLYFALKEPRPKPLAAGLVAAAMLLMRPNLLLLAGAPVVAWLWPCIRGRNSWQNGAKDVLMFAIGVAPAVVAVALINWRLYGSPLESGYGGLSGDMYELGRWPQNLRVYLKWLVQSQTVLVSLAALPFFARDALRSDSGRSSARAGVAALLALSLISYLFYYVFDVWFYLRFLLPALPALFVLMAAGIRAIAMRVPLALRAPVAVLLVCGCVPFNLRFAFDNRIFHQQEFEQRHVRAAHYVEQLTPQKSIILAIQHSGSVRYYANRITLRYDYLAPDGLDAAIRELNEKGYRPYIVIDDWEETEFRNRFAKANRVGRLDWRPLVRVIGNPEVRIYDPEGRATP
jgi:hypothetical protein